MSDYIRQGGGNLLTDISLFVRLSVCLFVCLLAVKLKQIFINFGK